jgi:hypothetical protein
LSFRFWSKPRKSITSFPIDMDTAQ